MPPEDVYANCVCGGFLSDPDSGYYNLTYVMTYTHRSHPDAYALRYGNTGKLRKVYDWEYDDHGSITTYSRDEDGDGVADRLRRYQYDAWGRMVSWAEEDNDMGFASSIQTFDYDRYGDLFSEMWDFQANGDPEYVTWHTYDGYGQRVETVRGGHGEVTSVKYLTWHDGRPVLDENDFGADGSRHEIATHYLYDDEGRLERIEKRNRHSGALGEHITFAYNETGWLIRRSRYAHYEDSTTYAYDDAGRVVEQQGPDGRYRSATCDCPSPTPRLLTQPVCLLLPVQRIASANRLSAPILVPGP